jgi:hypothetical protein
MSTEYGDEGTDSSLFIHTYIFVTFIAMNDHIQVKLNRWRQAVISSHDQVALFALIMTMRK